jgi:Right handed beta helix region
MTIASRQAAAVAAFLVALTLAVTATAAPTFSRIVDCTRGQSISRALEHSPPGAKLVLTVRGTCSESVVIDRDDVTLQGDAGVGGAIHGTDPASDTILLQGNRITLSRIAITGGQNGITVSGASNVSIIDSEIRETGASGVRVVGSQSVWIDRGRIERNPGTGINLERAASLTFAHTVVTGNRGAGLHVGEKSNAASWDNTISYNGSNGVQAFDGSQVSLWNTTITGNGTDAANTVNFRNGVAAWSSTVNIGGCRIADHPSSGVRATLASVTIGGSTIAGNGEGVMLYLASQLIMHSGSNVVSGNRGIGILLSTNSTGTIAGAMVQFNAGDGIVVQWGSVLVFFIEAPTTSGGNGGFGLRCGDAQPSIVWMNPLVAEPPNGDRAVSANCAAC